MAGSCPKRVYQQNHLNLSQIPPVMHILPSPFPVPEVTADVMRLGSKRFAMQLMCEQCMRPSDGPQALCQNGGSKTASQTMTISIKELMQTLRYIALYH
jgi:hypothetical protein